MDTTPAQSIASLNSSCKEIYQIATVDHPKLACQVHQITKLSRVTVHMRPL